MMLPFDATIRVSLIILIALAGTLVFRRRSAAVRHWVLALGIACAALSPLLHVFLPSWDIDIIAFSSAPPGAAAPPAVTTAVAVQHLGTPSPQLGPSEVGQGAPRGRIPLSSSARGVCREWPRPPGRSGPDPGSTWRRTCAARLVSPAVSHCFRATIRPSW